jgi:hypothetical protein
VPDMSSKGAKFVISSLREARRRLASIDSNKKMLDVGELWEAYCDLEQSIEVSKYIFNIAESIGTYRKLVSSIKNDPTMLSPSELAKRFKRTESNIDAALEAFERGRGEEEIEFARKARDELKIMLLGRKKTERAGYRKRASQARPK